MSAEFSLAPFWFWNDHLDPEEIVRQLADFRAHGVEAFVIHPRVGLPKDTGWMSERLLDCMEAAITEAERHGMRVYLYDEGMYPSGSASGRVAASNPDFACRGLQLLKAPDYDPSRPWQEHFAPEDDARLVAEVTGLDGVRGIVVDRKTHSGIRGLHYHEEPPPGTAHSDSLEEKPAAGNILDRAATECFIAESYAKFYERFGQWFGTTIRGIFTDEPGMLGRMSDPSFQPGNAEFLRRTPEWLGYDFTPHLPALWWDLPDCERLRADYWYALGKCLEENFYAPISQWCVAHDVDLLGHPDAPDDIGHMRHFQIPTQDLVLRRVEPGKPNGLEGRESTQGKAAASVMVHTGARRNGNEFCGAYGEDFTFPEMQRLAWWLLVRGCNLLMPHAFYYSTRGPRRTERPPDVGPNSPWWDDFKPFAEAARYLCELNTDCQPRCDVAVLGGRAHLPWRAPKVLFENQIDFHYVDAADLRGAKVEPDGTLRIGPMRYRAVVFEDAPAADLREQLKGFDGWVSFAEDAFLPTLRAKTQIAPLLAKAPANIRQRHIAKNGGEYLMLFNESSEPATLEVADPRFCLRLLWNEQQMPQTFTPEKSTEPLSALDLPPYGFALLEG